MSYASDRLREFHEAFEVERDLPRDAQAARRHRLHDVPGGPKGHLLCPDCGGSGRGKPLKREDGKILKGEHWQKPSMAEAIKP